MKFHCKICHSNRIELGKRFGLYHCPTCGVYFSDPNQWPKNFVSFYEQAYRGEDPSTRLAYFENKQDLAYLKACFEKKIAEIRDFRPGPLLDVGCGRGMFLEMASWAGFEVLGLEISKTVIRSVPKSIRAKIRLGNIENTLLPKNFFKVITLFNVLEHLLNPLSALRNVHSALRPGGAVLLTAPNIDSLPAKLFGQRWWGFKPDHIFFFNPQSLKELLRRSGFSMIEVSRDHSLYYAPSEIWKIVNYLLLGRLPKNFHSLGWSRPKIPLPTAALRAWAIKLE